MPPIRRAAVTGLFALWLAPLAAMAESQSSNSSSNCSNGRCTRVESYTVEDRHGRRGWVTEERWREGRQYRRRDDDDRILRLFGRPGAPWGYHAPRRGRDDDDDD
jgi:hypothetical protein